MLAFKLIRSGVALLVVVLAWQAAQAAPRLPVAAEAGPPATMLPTTAPRLPTAPTPVWPFAPIRLEWFSACDPTQMQLGLYTLSDGACSPSRTVPLEWLQNELKIIGLLSADEVLQRAQNVEHPDCGALVVGGPAPAGWLCADAYGLYRLEAPKTRWQLQLNGEWAALR